MQVLLHADMCRQIARMVEAGGDDYSLQPTVDLIRYLSRHLDHFHQTGEKNAYDQAQIIISVIYYRSRRD